MTPTLQLGKATERGMRCQRHRCQAPVHYAQTSLSGVTAKAIACAQTSDGKVMTSLPDAWYLSISGTSNPVQLQLRNVY